jgi:hypothetical protein
MNKESDISFFHHFETNLNKTSQIPIIRENDQHFNIMNEENFSIDSGIKSND